MDLGIEGDVAVVVGSGSGIGAAIAQEFTREGCRVGWIDKSASVHEVANRNGDSGSSTSIVADATDYDQMRSAADQVDAELGSIRHLVIAVAAGSGKFGFPFWNLHPGDWLHSVNVTLIGAVTVCHAFVPKMLPSSEGSICMIASVAGQIGSQTDPPYSAAKAGLINFAQCAAKDMAPHNIRVNVVSPGMVKTPMNMAVWEAWRAASPANQLSYDDWAEQKIKQIAPLGRWQQPEDIAVAVTFLASDRAQNITGQTVNVDGGQVMHS